MTIITQEITNLNAEGSSKCKTDLHLFNLSKTDSQLSTSMEFVYI